MLAEQFWDQSMIIFFEADWNILREFLIRFIENA